MTPQLRRFFPALTGLSHRLATEKPLEQQPHVVELRERPQPDATRAHLEWREIEVVIGLDSAPLVPRARLPRSAPRQRDRLEPAVIERHEMQADERRLRPEHRHPEKLFHEP